jgi:hypothetical protein
MTDCALRMTSADFAETLESDFRVLQMSGSGPALLAAIKEASPLNRTRGTPAIILYISRYSLWRGVQLPILTSDTLKSDK